MTTSWAPLTGMLLGPSAVPVYDQIKEHAQMYWASTAGSLYLSTSRPAVAPIRVMSLNEGNYILELGFSALTWPPNLGPMPTGTVLCNLAGYYAPKGGSFEDTPCTNIIPNIPFTFPLSSFSSDLTLNAPRSYLPWGLRGQIQFRLWLPEHNNATIVLDTVDVELYFVANANLPDFLFRGLPATFFRRFLLPLRLMTTDADIGAFVDSNLNRNIGDNQQGWLTYVIEKLFYQKHIQYDSLGGGSYHFFQGGSNPLNFDLWASDCDEPRMSQINCYDLAALVQAIVPLGLRDKQNTLQMKRMFPYGYINTTNLIGRGPCNNPLGTPLLMENINNPARTPFGRHVFMTIAPSPSTVINGPTEKVLDATTRSDTGPHDGTQDLTAYIASSIDDKTTLYTADLKRGTLVTGPEGNSINWDGVSQLITAPEIFSPNMLSASDEDNNILAGIPGLFPNWTKTDPNIVINSSNLSAEWHFSSTNQLLLNIQLTLCATDDIAAVLYSEALQRLRDNGVTMTDKSADAPAGIQTFWRSNKFISQSNSACSTGSQIVTLWTQGAFYVNISLSAVSGQTPSALAGGDISQYAPLVANFLGKAAVQPPPSILVNGREDCIIKQTYTMGKQFQVTVSGLPDERIPVNVDIKRAKVLYLSSSMVDDTVTFNFLARAPTVAGNPDVIRFATYNATMKHDWADVSIEVTINDS